MTTTSFPYDKKPFGAGVTPALADRFFFQSLISAENITIRAYEAFQKNGDYYESLGTMHMLPVSALAVATEKPALVHAKIFTPQHYGGNEIVHGPAFGLDQSIYLMPRSSVTINKAVDVFGVDKASLWAPHSAVFIPMDEFGRIRAPYNKYIKTLLSKADSATLIMDRFTAVIGQIYVGHHEEDFSGDGIRLTVNPDFGHDSNIEFDQIVPNDQAAYAAFAQNFFPTIATQAEVNCQAGQIVEIPIEVLRPDGSLYSGDCLVYTKCDIGVVVTNKINALNGVGTVRYMALGLISGEQATVKIGFKWYENEATTTVSVQ